MSVAEKLKAEGRQEGRIEGLVGQIQLLEEVLGLALSPREKLESLDLGELETRFQELHRDYKGLSKDR